MRSASSRDNARVDTTGLPDTRSPAHPVTATCRFGGYVTDGNETPWLT
jgi:hypothetical protein